MDNNFSYSESKELTQAKKLIDECKLDETDQIIKTFEEKGGHTLHDIVLCHLLKCKLLSERGFHEDVVKLAEQTYKDSLGLGKNLLSVDILLIMANALLWLFQMEKPHDIIKQGEELLKTLTQELPIEYKQREVYIAYLKGWDYLQKGDDDQAIKQFELSISLGEDLGAKKEIAYSLVGLTRFYAFRKGDLDRALKCLEQGMALAEESGNKGCIGYCLYYLARLLGDKGELDRSVMYGERSLTIFNDINNKFMKARVLNTLGESFAMKGELNRSIRFHEQSLALIKEFNNKFVMAQIFDGLSSCHQKKGEFNRALEYIEQSMALYRELGTTGDLAYNYDILMQILIDKGDLEKARNTLEQFDNEFQFKDEYFDLIKKNLKKKMKNPTPRK